MEKVGWVNATKVRFCHICQLTVGEPCPWDNYEICALFKSQVARGNAPAKPSSAVTAEIIESDAAYASSLGCGKKDDDGKVPLDLLAPEFLILTAEVLQFGAKKYASYNWAKGMKWSRVFAALMRHMWSWWGGEKLDPETGISHLGHAACGLMFLIAYEQRGTGEDDRWKS